MSIFDIILYGSYAMCHAHIDACFPGEAGYTTVVPCRARDIDLIVRIGPRVDAFARCVTELFGTHTGLQLVKQIMRYCRCDSHVFDIRSCTNTAHIPLRCDATACTRVFHPQQFGGLITHGDISPQFPLQHEFRPRWDLCSILRLAPARGHAWAIQHLTRLMDAQELNVALRYESSYAYSSLRGVGLEISYAPHTASRVLREMPFGSFLLFWSYISDCTLYNAEIMAQCFQWFKQGSLEAEEEMLARMQHAPTPFGPVLYLRRDGVQSYYNTHFPSVPYKHITGVITTPLRGEARYVGHAATMLTQPADLPKIITQADLPIDESQQRDAIKYQWNRADTATINK